MALLIEIEFIQDWKDCWHKGDRREVQAHFAFAMIEAGIAKRVDKPNDAKEPKE